MAEIVYLRMRNRIQKKLHDKVLLKDLAQIVADTSLTAILQEICVYEISEQDQNIIVIDSTQVLRKIREINKNIEIQLIGPAQTIIEVIF